MLMADPIPETSAGPQLSVSVVTHNNAECLPGFFNSLRQQTELSWELFFFDNASQDGTQQVLRAAAPGRWFASETNIGYGRAHNYNATRCSGRYILLSNPDLVFGPGVFSGLVSYLEEHPEYALAGPQVVEGRAKRPFSPRRFYPGEGMLGLKPGLRRQEIAWLSGCCLLVRREVFEELGGFDPDYLLYQEDADFCLRLRSFGYRIGSARRPIVHHLHRQSQQGLSEYEYARRVFQGSAVFWRKHYRNRDVLRMMRFQYWTSRFLLSLKPMLEWLPELPTVLSEARLRARMDICRLELEQGGNRRLGVAGLPGKITLRHCHLALEWILQGRFPLDDY